MGTIRSVAGWAIIATCGCSTAPQETDIKESGITTRSATTEHNYVAVDPTSTIDEERDAGVIAPNDTLSEAAGAEDAGDDESAEHDNATREGVTHDGSDGETPAPTAEPSSSSPADSSQDTAGEAAGSTAEGAAASSASTEVETTPSTCRETAGLCDPTGGCATSDCDFEHSGKTCGYTPDRTYPFMCVVTANYEPYRPCDSDDVCAPGSVCISKVALLLDGSFYTRPAPVCRPTCSEDADCGDGEWCEQATDDDNQPIPDLKVCHRHCSTEADCYVGEGDGEVRCSNAQVGAPPSSYECSRYRPAVSEPATDETSAGAPTATGDSAESQGGPAPVDSANSGLSSGLALQALSVRGVEVECLFAEQCKVGFDCVDYACVQRCETSDECDGSECQFVEGRGTCGAICDKPADAECGLLPTNCGCDAGETCQLGADFRATCAAPGPNPAMTWCNDSGDCGSGLSCMAGLCRPLCEPESDDCGPGAGECVLSVSARDGDIYACAGYCDPVESPNCGAGAVCLPGFDSHHHHRAMCVAESPDRAPRDKGGECTADYDCKTGLGCDAKGTCQAWCRTDDDCATGRTCSMNANIPGYGAGRFGSSPDDAVGLCQAAE